MAIIYSNSASLSKYYPSYRLLDGGLATRFGTLEGLLESTIPAFGAGTLWEADIYRYTEAPATAVDHHVTTAGGVKLYVVPVYGTNVPIYPLRAFGAAEDGVRDDSTEVIRAMTTIQENGGGGLLLNGSSRLTRTIWITDWAHDFMLIGNNRDSDGLYMSASDKPLIAGTADAPFHFTMDTIHLRGPWAETPQESGEEAWLLDIFDVTTLITRNCRFFSSQKGLLKARAHEAAESWYCHFEESTRDGWNMTGSRNTKFIGNTVKHVRDDAVALHVSRGNSDPTVGQHIVSQNYFQDCQGIAALGARNMIVTNNVGNLIRSRFCVVGVSSTWGEGELSAFNIIVENNLVQDQLDAGFFESSSIVHNYYIHIYPITPSEAGSTGGIPGEAAAGGGIVPLYGSFDAVGSSASFPPGIGISISGNKFLRTRKSGVAYSSYGYGLFITPTGYADATPSDSHLSPECRFRSGIRDFEFRNNMVQGAKYGIFFSYSNSSFFRNGLVSGNTFKDTISGCFATNADTGTNILNVRFEDNLIDGDPFYSSAGRGMDGSFATEATMPAFNLPNCNGWTGKGNHVFNCSRVENFSSSTRFWSGLNYQYGRCVSDSFSTSNRGIGRPASLFGTSGWVLVDYDADTTSATHGEIARHPLTSASQPDSGYYLRGTLITNTNRDEYGLPNTDGQFLLGWRRLTTGNGHVAGTDWQPIYELAPVV